MGICKHIVSLLKMPLMKWISFGNNNTKCTEDVNHVDENDSQPCSIIHDYQRKLQGRFVFSASNYMSFCMMGGPFCSISHFLA